MTENLSTIYFRMAPDTADELLTVAEACELLRISKTKLYSYIHARQLATVRLGSRRLIPYSAIQAFVAQHTTEATT